MNLMGLLKQKCEVASHTRFATPTTGVTQVTAEAWV